jgi:RNA polymerase-interacting CarD/CdnL/TRCF family regulator
MTRAEAIARIAANAEKLNDEQLAGLAAFTAALVRPSVYSSLPPAEKALLDAALDRLDRGEGIPGDEVFDRLDARVSSAKATT